MTQILDSLSTHCSNGMLCCYINDTHQITVIRITNITDWYFERVVFPGERLLFEAPADAQLEIYATHAGTVDLVKRIMCDRLTVKNSQTGQACFVQQQEVSVEQLEKSFDAETFISEEGFSDHFARESEGVSEPG